MNKRSRVNKIFFGMSIVLGLVCCALVVGIINNYNIISSIDSLSSTADSAKTDSPAGSTTDTTSEKPSEASTEKPASSTSEPKTDVPFATDKPTNSNDVNTHSGKKTVYLTFDDGPSERTREILAVLDKYGVKATFFVIYHEGTEDILRDINKRGHAIALHAYKHVYSDIYRSEDAFFNDLNKISDWVEGATGVKSKITRFPGGGSNTVSKKYKTGIMTTLTKEIRNKGYQYFDWNCDSGDASGNNIAVSTLVSRVKNGISSSAPEVCVLMHDSHAKKTTVEALPQIIEHFKNNGYVFEVLTVNSNGFHHSVNN